MLYDVPYLAKLSDLHKHFAYTGENSSTMPVVVTGHKYTIC